jgi:hypothetical protein
MEVSISSLSVPDNDIIFILINDLNPSFFLTYLKHLLLKLFLFFYATFLMDKNLLQINLQSTYKNHMYSLNMYFTHFFLLMLAIKQHVFFTCQ